MLYKYLPPCRIDVLENLKIRFTQPSSLNDPYELFRLVRADGDVEALQREGLEGLEKIYDELDPDQKNDENRRILEHAKLTFLKQSKRKLSTHALGRNTMKLIDKTFGILSLSRVKDSLLMWAHYAESFSGMVIGFDSGHPFFHQPSAAGEASKPYKVTYSSSRRSASVDDLDYYGKLLCEKPIEWAYEQEERIVHYFGPGVEMAPEAVLGLRYNGPCDSIGNPIFLVDLPRDLVREIVVGFRASDQCIAAVIAARDRHFPEVPICRAVPSRTHYRVEFRKLATTREKGAPKSGDAV